MGLYVLMKQKIDLGVWIDFFYNLSYNETKIVPVAHGAYIGCVLEKGMG